MNLIIRIFKRLKYAFSIESIDDIGPNYYDEHRHKAYQFYDSTANEFKKLRNKLENMEKQSQPTEVKAEVEDEEKLKEENIENAMKYLGLYKKKEESKLKTHELPKHVEIIHPANLEGKGLLELVAAEFRKLIIYYMPKIANQEEADLMYDATAVLMSYDNRPPSSPPTEEEDIEQLKLERYSYKKTANDLAERVAKLELNPPIKRPTIGEIKVEIKGHTKNYKTGFTNAINWLLSIQPDK